MIGKIVFLLCDFCYQETKLTLPSPTTGAEARRRARAELGWIHQDGGDICPTCQPQWAKK